MSDVVRDALAAELDARQAEFVELCADLIRCRTENPPGDTRAAHAFIAAYLDARGIPFDTVAPQPDMPNIVSAFKGGSGPGPHLVLNGHLDVFPAGDHQRWTVDPFAGEVRDGRLYGRGANDMRAGVTASLITFTALYAMRERLRGRLTLTLVSDEESFGPWGAAHLVDHDPRVLGDAVLSGEGSGMEAMLFGEKGLCWLAVTVETPGGHGGMVHVSANAVKEASRIIADLEALTTIEPTLDPAVVANIDLSRAVLERTAGPGAADVMPAITVNIGPIQGGDRVNMISNFCRVEVDLRWPPGMRWEDLRERFAAIVERSPSARWEIMNLSEPNVCDPEAQIFQLLAENAAERTGIRPIPALTLGGTDCRLWRWRGIPSVVFGPTTHNIGAPDEYVVVAELIDVVTIHAMTAFDYLMGGRV